MFPGYRVVVVTKHIPLAGNAHLFIRVVLSERTADSMELEKLIKIGK